MKNKLKRITLSYYLLFSLLFFILSSCVSCSNGSDTLEPEQEQIEDDEPPIALTTFRNPVLASGPDPWVFKNGDEYFVTFTTGNNITLVRTNKMSDLKNGTQKVIWTPPASGMNSKEIWAPELHRINGIWYLYYAASNGDNRTHRMWVLENTSDDPFQGIWLDKGELKLPDDKWAIDGSPFELNGILYPQVTEAPQFLLKNNKAFIFYSAGGCWRDGYSVGAISMDSSSDPMVVSSWERLVNNPLLTSNNTGNAFGPGHNSFFKSSDGEEDWILYHANPQPGQGCGGERSIRMQKFSWDNNDLPIIGNPEPLNKDLLKPSGE